MSNHGYDPTNSMDALENLDATIDNVLSFHVSPLESDHNFFDLKSQFAFPLEEGTITLSSMTNVTSKIVIMRPVVASEV